MKLEEYNGLFLKQLRKQEQDECLMAHNLGLIELKYESILHQMFDLRTIVVKPVMVH